MNLRKTASFYFGGKKVLLYGLGLQGGGEGVARFLVWAGAKLTVTDAKPESNFAGAVKKLRNSE